MMVLADGYLLLRRVGDSIHITELSHDEVAPRRRVIRVERFLDELRDEPQLPDTDTGADYKPGAATNRSFDR